MMTDYQYENRIDNSALLTTEDTPVSVSGVSRFRRWSFHVLTTVVILVLIIVLGVSNMKTANHLWSVEQRVSNQGDIIQSLNTSLQHAQERVKEVQQLQFAVENNKDQLISVAEALKQLSGVDSLSRSVALLKCSLERIINNSSAADGCCPLGWEQFGLNCYFFSSLSLSWNESRVWCDKQEAHLLILHTDKAWDFVTHRTVPELFWVGLSEWRTGRWEWVNQTPYTMERRRWVPGQPDSRTGHGFGSGNGDCAHVHFDGCLNDVHCSTKMRYICQKHSMRT